MATVLVVDDEPIVREGRLLLDCRTLTDEEADEVAAAVAAARG